MILSVGVPLFRDRQADRMFSVASFVKLSTSSGNEGEFEGGVARGAFFSWPANMDETPLLSHRPYRRAFALPGHVEAGPVPSTSLVNKVSCGVSLFQLG